MRDIPRRNPNLHHSKLRPGLSPNAHAFMSWARNGVNGRSPMIPLPMPAVPIGEVKLPEFNRKLRPGSYEIHIHNTTESRVRVAIVSEEGGLEVSIGPKAHEETRVGRGTYQFYFIYDDSPYTLHQGQRIPVKELLTDFIVYLFDDSSTVDLL